jgi:broad specificity phosphatase PhoE
LILNKDTEEFFQVNTPLSTLDALQAQLQEHLCSISGIPVVKLLGIQPAGLNASSAGELESWYDWVEAYQESFFTEPLTRVMHFAMLSLWGAVDPEITFSYESLRSDDPVQQANVQKLKAETDDILIASGSISQAESRKRIATDPESGYEGIDVDDLPQLEEGPESIDIRGTERPDAILAKERPGMDAGEIRRVLFIRHGATRLNNEDVSVDRIRGWKDIPLSPEGEEEAERLGEELKKRPPDALVTSDLRRARDTARIISRAIGIPVAEATKGFRPWDVGDYAGELSKKAIPVLARYAAEEPDEPTPDGESFERFRSRFFAALADALDDHSGTVAIVSHHRDERLLVAWAKAGFPADGSIDMPTFNQAGEHTGAVTPVEIPIDRLRAVARAVLSEAA